MATINNDDSGFVARGIINGKLDKTLTEDAEIVDDGTHYVAFGGVNYDQPIKGLTSFAREGYDFYAENANNPANNSGISSGSGDTQSNATIITSTQGTSIHQASVAAKSSYVSGDANQQYAYARMSAGIGGNNVIFEIAEGTVYAGIGQVNSGALFIDNAYQRGILFYEDYSDNFTDLNVPNCKFVRNRVSTVSLPALNIAVGPAPTSPVDGDIWREDNTDTGLKIRINGVTKTIVVS